ncbi:MAG: YceI family protein [Anaerolineales bacterium]|jgi:polyisoprenoid-binding protein YceI
MSKFLIPLTLAVFLLVACGSQPTTEPSLESYPAPQQTEPVQQTEPPTDSGEEVYPPPYPTATLIADFGTVYPAPEGGLQTFTIIPGESEVSYEVGEVFLNQDNAFNVAIGVTSEVNGEIRVDPDNPQNSTLGTISVDISQFTSDNQRRDNTIRDRYLQSAQFPIVNFTPQEIQGLPETYVPGEEISFQITGDATIRDVTKPVTFDVTMVGNQDTITGEATTTILMSDFGFGPISIVGILNTEDEVKIKFDFVARP